MRSCVGMCHPSFNAKIIVYVNVVLCFQILNRRNKSVVS